MKEEHTFALFSDYDEAYRSHDQKSTLIVATRIDNGQECCLVKVHPFHSHIKIFIINVLKGEVNNPDFQFIKVPLSFERLQEEYEKYIGKKYNEPHRVVYKGRHLRLVS